MYDLCRILDRRALRNRRVLFTTKGAPFSVSVYHAGALAPATNVVIADELTCGQARNHEHMSYIVPQ